MTRATTWMDLPWAPFDCETTGIDVEDDVILSVAVAAVEPGKPTVHEYTLLNWEIDIPEGAARIHGLTRAKLSREGIDPAKALARVVDLLAGVLQHGPIVGMNLVFDLTMLDRNCRQLGIPTLSDRADIIPVLDVFVLDKLVDPYRKGKRNLEALCDHYRAQLDGAHNALSDAIASARVAWRIGMMYPRLGGLDSVLLHDLQVRAKADQDRSFRSYKLGKGEQVKPGELEGYWPIMPYLVSPANPANQPDQSLAGGVTPSIFDEEPPWG